jgi:translation initiation factor 2B subunit (eIF-2B alpha/beta/delta family)
MDGTMASALARLGADSSSGASELMPRALGILREAARSGPSDLVDVARAVGEVQPSMASFWRLALAALREAEEPGALERFEQRWRRAGAALVRNVVDQLAPPEGSALHVVTCSFSGSVLSCLRAVGRRVALRVSCAEGRPAFEGRRLAAALAVEGIPVELFSDAAVGEALWREPGRADVVLVGADAVTPAWVVNKAGTGMIAAAASRIGVPVYVAATREKFLDARVVRLLRVVEHDPSEIWSGPPPGWPSGIPTSSGCRSISSPASSPTPERWRAT